MTRSLSSTLVALLALVACRSSAEVQTGKVEDLGLKNGHVLSRQIVSSGQIDPAQLEALPAAGIRQIVCLRPATEDGTGWEEGKAAELGVPFVRIPVPGAEGLNRENALALTQVLATGQPTLVYCASGNRVGALLALSAYWYGGMPAEQVIPYGRAGGMTRLEPQVRAIVDQQK